MDSGQLETEGIVTILAEMSRGSAHAGETVKGEVMERCIQVYVASSVDYLSLKSS
jgi:hypothetical protein